MEHFPASSALSPKCTEGAVDGDSRVGRGIKLSVGGEIRLLLVSVVVSIYYVRILM